MCELTNCVLNIADDWARLWWSRCCQPVVKSVRSRVAPSHLTRGDLAVDFFYKRVIHSVGPRLQEFFSLTHQPVPFASTPHRRGPREGCARGFALVWLSLRTGLFPCIVVEVDAPLRLHHGSSLSLGTPGFLGSASFFFRLSGSLVAQSALQCKELCL